VAPAAAAGVRQESTSEGEFGTGANSARIDPGKPLEKRAKTKMSGTIGVDLSCAPDPFGTLAIRGPDAAKFLQGQLSADLENLAPGASTLAGLHNPQGRVIALLGLVRATSDEFFAALPGELAATVAGLMRKYILRSKVKI
jgi:hypothetical protein